jgi:xylan 1,4-beta-xylosidase
VDMTLAGLRPGTVIQIETMDNTHGNIYETYKAVGSPHSPDREMTGYLRQQSWNTIKESFVVDKSGFFQFKRTLAPWTCVLIRQI